MKRKLLSLIFLCAAGAMALAGCSNSDGGSASAKVTLGNYIGVKATVTETVITDEQVDQALKEDVSSKIEAVDVTDRPVQDGDIANINYAGKINGVAFEGGTAEGSDLTIGSGSFIDDFEEQLIGMAIGETADITVTFPDPYQNNPDLAGAEAVFTVTINSIKVKNIPDEITDEVIQQISDEYKTVDEYRAYIKESMEAQAEQRNISARKQAVWEVILGECTIENLPEDRVQEYINVNKQNYQDYADSYGVDLATFLQNYVGTTEEGLNEQLQTSGETYVTDLVVAEAIAEELKLAVTDEEYQSFLQEQASSQSADVATFEQKYGTFIRNDLVFQKVIEYVVEKAEITTTTE